MHTRRIELNAAHRTVTVDGRSTVLQEQTWRVLELLVSRAPTVVTRDAIIDAVWRGNFLTGDKGLNQAVWALRSALGDSAREPVFIRTVPRCGYQWIHAEAATETPACRTRHRAAALAGLVLAGSTLAYLTGGTPPTDNDAGTTAGMVATRAYLVDRDIHVEFDTGCLGILKNRGHTKLGTPVLSADGSQVAVAVHDEASCRLMTIELADGRRHDFGECPTADIG